VGGESAPNTGTVGTTGTTGTAGTTGATGSTGVSLPLRVRHVAAGQPVAVRQLRRGEPGNHSPDGSPADSPRDSPADEADGPYLGSFSRGDLQSGSSGPRSRPLSPPPPPALLPHAFSSAAASSVLGSPSAASLGPPPSVALAPGASAVGSRAEVARQLVLRHSEQRAPAWQSLQPAAAADELQSVASAGGGPSAAARPASVAALHLGAWRFKGAPSAVPMAAVALEPLAGRGFPADAPSGKGQRLEERSGALGAAVVLLPEQLPPAPPVRAAAAAAGSLNALAAPAARRLSSWSRRRPPSLLPR
jgi:hypothetical protein